MRFFPAEAKTQCENIQGLLGLELSFASVVAMHNSGSPIKFDLLRIQIRVMRIQRLSAGRALSGNRANTLTIPP